MICVPQVDRAADAGHVSEAEPQSGSRSLFRPAGVAIEIVSHPRHSGLPPNRYVIGTMHRRLHWSGSSSPACAGGDRPAQGSPAALGGRHGLESRHDDSPSTGVSAARCHDLGTEIVVMMMDPTGNIGATKAALSSGDPLGSRTLASRAPSRPANQHSCRKSTGPRISEGSQGWLIKPVRVPTLPKP